MPATGVAGGNWNSASARRNDRKKFVREGE
jgi:hypothetical protein